MKIFKSILVLLGVVVGLFVIGYAIFTAKMV